VLTRPPQRAKTRFSRFSPAHPQRAKTRFLSVLTRPPQRAKTRFYPWPWPWLRRSPDAAGVQRS